MFEINFISHSEATNEQLLEIVKVKDVAWPHSRESQFRWFDDNLKESDIHVLLTKNNYAIAYLNLIKIEFKIDDVFVDGYGIGNVCSRERGKGWGKEIMIQANMFLIQNKKPGLLFCRNHSVHFYKITEWLLIDKNKLTLAFNNESIETMIRNSDKEFNNLEYLGKLF